MLPAKHPGWLYPSFWKKDMEGFPLAEPLHRLAPLPPRFDLLVTPHPKPPCTSSPALWPGFGFDKCAVDDLPNMPCMRKIHIDMQASDH